MEKKRRAKIRGQPLQLFLAAGSLENQRDSGNIAGDVRKFARAFNRYSAARVHTEIFAGETHDSAFPVAVTRGLRTLLARHR